MTASRFSPATEQGFFITLLCSLGGHLLILLLWLVWPGGLPSHPATPLTVRIVPEAQSSAAPAMPPPRRPALTPPRREPRPLAQATTTMPAPAQPEPVRAAATDVAATIPQEIPTVATPSLAAATAEFLPNLAAGDASLPPDTAATAQRDAYLQTLRQRIERHRDYPLLARKGRQQGNVVVRFFLDRQGGLREVAITVPCGSALLNRAALRAVSEAAPFPPLPPELDTATPFDVPVAFRLD